MRGVPHIPGRRFGRRPGIPSVGPQIDTPAIPDPGSRAFPAGTLTYQVTESERPLQRNTSSIPKSTGKPRTPPGFMGRRLESNPAEGLPMDHMRDCALGAPPLFPGAITPGPGIIRPCRECATQKDNQDSEQDKVLRVRKHVGAAHQTRSVNLEMRREVPRRGDPHGASSLPQSATLR
jgi:hypothetical protein